MRSDLKLLLSIPFFFFFLSILNAQTMKWGKIPKEDLEMTVYEPYPEADAVVLGDDGFLTLDLTGNKYSTSLEVHYRVKILKKSAFDRGDVTITYQTGSGNRLTGLKAQIISPSGKVVKLNKKHIFTEKVTKGLMRKKIAFPNIQEGSILEYKYTKKEVGINQLPVWYFQSDIPVKWSRYRVHTPEFFDYIALLQGRQLDVSTVERENGRLQVQGGAITADMVKRDYVLKNAPPLKQESFITTMLDYMTRVRFQLKGVNFPNQPYQPVLTSWAQVAKDLAESDFGKQYLKKNSYKKIAKSAGEAISAEATQEESLDKLYTYVQKNIKWNGRYGFYPNNIEDTFEKKGGSSADINMLLIALLRNAGIKAYPALISTRGHGKHITTYPIIDQFNHLIVYAIIDDKPVFLDAIHDAYAPGYLPVNSLNKQAWLVLDDSFKWVDINASKASKSTQAIMVLDSDGKLEGTIKCRRTNYQAFGLRKKFLDKGEDVFIEEGIQKDFPDADINEYSAKKPEENTTAFQDQIDISIPDYAETNGDFLYINPMLNEAYDENPFKMEKRDYPVEIPYPFSENYIFNMTIPEGYVVESLPKSAAIVVDGKSALFNYTIAEKDNKIQLVLRMSVSKTYFSPENYAPLKQFYDLIVEKQGEQIVLKKS